ncbi:MAG: hypothetical protein MI923_06060 [Phycisphaerales bacterium]|nr:hypothetical protein [Phycisphaerales bacterium]
MTAASDDFGPKPTPEDGPGHEIALKPFAPPTPPSPSRRQVQVIHDADPSGRKPSATRLAIGFILVVAAAMTILIPFDYLYDKLTVWFWGEGPPAESWVKYGLDGLQYGSGIVLLISGGLCITFSVSAFFRYLLTTALIAVSAYLANLLLGTGMKWQWLVLVSVALSYLVHACGDVARPSIRGVIGWAVIAFCCFGCHKNWFDWADYGAKLGDGAVRFFEDWGTGLFTWLTVLVLSAIGISCSKTKPIHFLNAALLAALAYYCFQDGYVRMISFPELGEHIDPLPKASLDNIEVWRWVVLGELVLLAAVLLHMALGVGSLTIAFAIAWLALSLNVDKKLGSDAMVAFYHAENLAAGGASPISIFPAAPDGKQPMVRKLTDEESKANVFKARVRLGVIFGWVYLTSILAGLIAIGGLRMLLPNKKGRLWIGFALWFAFGLGMAWLWTVWPEVKDWESRLESLIMVGAHRYAVCLVGVGFMALLGSWALREGSRYETWLIAAVTGILIGTSLTLVGIALLDRYGGFSPLPVWAYAAIAAGQSSMMWVLLMHHSLRARSSTALEGTSVA